mmetsp:Transcript_7705/g.11780  ORF Transcript_7705/g.11780 Transcript_7705/m.11780 type:complete len:500 (-) Transcript_7705:1679-3178(-)
MGNTLDKPITEKYTETSSKFDYEDRSSDGGNHDSLLAWGASSMQGWRISMEDEFICQRLNSIDCDQGFKVRLKEPHYLFCVLDGHGGADASKFVSHHLATLLCRQPPFQTYAKLLAEEKEDTKIIKLRGKAKARNKKEKCEVKNGNQRRIKKCKLKPSNRPDSRKNHLIELLQQALEDAFVETDMALLQHVKGESLINDPVGEKCNMVDGQQNDDDDWNVSFADIESEATLLNKPFNRAINKVEKESKQEKAEDADESGTTVTAVLVTPDFIICANAGDSRAAMLIGPPCHAGCSSSVEDLSKTSVVPLSFDHKPDLPEEMTRIEKAGGAVNFGRVDGLLAVSRALGDFEFKDYSLSSRDDKKIMENSNCDNDEEEKSCQRRCIAQKLKVTPFPEVLVKVRNDFLTDEEEGESLEEKIMVVACDGIWDVMSNEECLELTRALIQDEGEKDMGLVAEEIMDLCLKKGSRDNMTAIVVKFSGQKIGNGGGVRKRRSKRGNH